MRKRRLRATLLLKTIIALVSVALFVGVVSLASGTASLLAVGAILVLWFIGIEAELLPMAIEALGTERAERGSGRVSSLWFIDVEAESRQELEALRDGVSNNPSLR